MNDRRGVKGIDVSDIPDLIGKSEEIAAKLKELKDAFQSNPPKTADICQELADELAELIGQDATQEVAYLRDHLRDWDEQLREAGADLDLDSIDDKDAFIDKVKVVFEALNQVAHEADAAD